MEANKSTSGGNKGDGDKRGGRGNGRGRRGREFWANQKADRRANKLKKREAAGKKDAADDNANSDDEFTAYLHTCQNSSALRFRKHPTFGANWTVPKESWKLYGKPRTEAEMQRMIADPTTIPTGPSNVPAAAYIPAPAPAPVPVPVPAPAPAPALNPRQILGYQPYTPFAAPQSQRGASSVPGSVFNRPRAQNPPAAAPQPPLSLADRDWVHRQPWYDPTRTDEANMAWRERKVAQVRAKAKKEQEKARRKEKAAFLAQKEAENKAEQKAAVDAGTQERQQAMMDYWKGKTEAAVEALEAERRRLEEARKEWKEARRLFDEQNRQSAEEQK